MNNGIFKFNVFRRRSAACKAVATVSAFAMLALTPATALSAAVPLTGPADVLANVNGGAVISGVTGSMTLDTDLTAANINLTSGGAGLINWSALNIGNGQSLEFSGGNFYNVVGGADASKIAGQLNASGSLWIFNPAGVSFMNGAQVNVGGLFGVAAAGLENESAIKDAISGGSEIPSPVLEASAASVAVANGAKFIVGGDMALVGKSVAIDSGADFSKVGALKVAAGEKVSIDDVGGGKVSLDITQFADVDDDINVTFGGGETADINIGDGDDYAGDVDVITEGSILVNEAVVAKGDVTFKTLVKAESEVVVGHKQMSVASGKLLQGKSVSATAAGRVSVGGDVEATDGDVSIKSDEYVNVAKAATITSTGGVTIDAVGNVNMGGTVAAAGDVLIKATGGEGASAKSVKVGFDGAALNSEASVSGKNVTMEGKMSSQVLAGSVTATGTDAKDGVTMSGGEYVAVNGAVSGKDVTLETTERATLSKDHSELGLKKDDPAGILVTAAGTVTAADSLTMTSKGVISAGGVVKVTSEDAQVALGAEGGKIALSNEGNAIKGTVDVTGGDVDIKGDGNDFDYGKVAADESGNITLQGNGKDVTVKESVTASGTFTVNDAEDITLKDDVQVGAAVLAASKTIEQDTGKKLEAKDGITLTAGEGVTLKGSVNADTDGENGGNLVVMKNDTDNGDLLQDGGEIRANELTAAEFTQTGDGKLYANVINADVKQNGCEIVDNGDKTITVNGDFTQTDGTLGASDTVQITINGVLEQNAVNSDPDRALIQADEVILNDAATQGGELAGDTIKATTLTVNAEGKDISLASAANEVGTLQGKGDDVSVTTSTALDLGALEAESLTVRAGGEVSQPGSAVVEGLVDITAEYSDGSGANVALLGTENQFGSVKVKGGKIEIKEKDDVVIAGIDGSILYVEAGPSGDPVEYTKTITQNETGDIKTSFGARFYGSSVKLDNEGNAIGPRLSARADDGDVEIVNNGPISIEDDSGYTDVKGVTASGVVKLTAKAGDITMFNAAELSGTSVDVVAEDGNILLNKGKVLVTAADGAATFSAENGAISAQNADNDFKSVTATAKSVALNDKDDVTVAQATATEGNVVVTAGAKMRVKGDITGESVDLDAGDFVNVAAGKTVKATSGAVDIEAAGNADVIGSVVAESGAVSVKATGAGKSVRVAGTVGGKTGVSLEGDKSVQIGGEVASSDGDVTATAKEFVAIDGGSVTAAKGTATLKTTDAELLTAGGMAATYSEGQLAGVTVGGAAAGTVAAKNVVVESAGSVLVNDGSSVTATAVEEAGGAVAITANGETEATVATEGITKQGLYILGTVTADGTLDVTAKGEGGILATGALVADNGAATLSAANGAIDAQNADNDFKSVTATAKSVTLNDKKDITLTAVTATDGDVRVRAAKGNLTVADATAVKVSGQDVRLEAAGLEDTEGAITVGAGVSGKNVTLAAKGDVTTKKEDSVANGALTAAGTGSDLFIESTEGNIELAADATAADTMALLADNGGIHAVNVEATTIYAMGKGDIKIDNATGTLITKTSGNVDVEFTDDGDHTVSYDADGYVKVTAKGKLTVDSATGGEDLKATEVLWPEGTEDKTLIDSDTQVSGVKAGTSVELESTASGVKVNTIVDAGTTVELKAKTNVEVDGAVVGKTGVTLTATDGDVTIGTDTAPGAVVKAGAFEIPSEDGVAPTIAEGDVANLAMTAGKGVTIQNAAQVGASGTVDVDAKAGGVTVTGEGTALAANGAMTVDADGGTVAVTEGAFVGGNDAVTIGGDGTTASVGVSGGTVAAKKALTANATGMVLVEGASKVASDTTATLTGANVMVIDEDAFVGAKEAVTIKAVGVKSVVGGELTITDGAVTIQEATVKAGSFTANPETGAVDTEAEGYTEGNLVIDADNSIYIGSGAQVGASGTVDVDAGQGGVQVVMHDADRPTRLVANKAMTIDAGTVVTDGGNDTVYGGGVTVMLDAYVGGNDSVTIGGAGTAKSVAVYDGTVAAKGALAVTATDAVSVRAGSKVAADATTTLKGASVTVDGTTTLVAAKGNVTLTATGTDVTVDKATVKAGSFSVDPDTGAVDTEAEGYTEGNLTIAAENAVLIQGAAKVGASGTVDVDAKAGGVTVTGEGTALAANGAMTVDADGGTVAVTEGAFVGGNDAVTIGGDGTTASVGVSGGTVAAKKALTANATGMVLVEGASKVASDKTVTLTGANVMLSGEDVYVGAKDAVTIGAVGVKTIDGDNLTITDGAVTINEATVKAGSFTADEETGDVDETAVGYTEGNLVIDADNSVYIGSGAQVGASGTVDVDAGKGGVQIMMHNADVPTRLVANKAMTIDAGTTEGGKVYGGGVAVMFKAYVGGNSTVNIGKDGTTESVSLYDGTVVAKDDVGITATGAISVRSGSKVGSDSGVEIGGASVTVKDSEVLAAVGIDIDAAGDIDVDGAVVKAGDFSVNEETGAVTIPDGAALADLTVTADGKVEISGGAEVGASGEAHLTANGADGVTVNGSKLAANGNMTIDATKDGAGSVDVTDGYVGTHGTLGITAAKDVTINTSIVESTDDLTIEAEGDVTVGSGSRVGTDGNLEITASGSTGINADGVLVADEDGKTAMLTAANGAIDAQNEANDFKSVVATAQSVNLRDVDDVALSFVEATVDNVVVTAGSMEVGEVRAVEQATLTATDGDITAGNAGTANVTAERALFDAANGAVGAGDNHIDISVDVVAATSKNGVFLTDGDGITVGTVGGLSGVKSTGNGAVVVEATAGNVDVTQAVEAKGADGNVLIAANADDGDVTVGAAVAAQNATVTAGNAVNVDANVVAAGDAYVEARNGDVEMSSGTTIKGNANNGTVFVGAAGTLKLASAEADTVWLRTGGSIENATIGGGGVKANNLMLDAGGHIGESGDNLQVDVGIIAASANGGGVYVHEANSAAIGSVNASVKMVKADGTHEESAGELAGITALSGDVSFDAGNTITVADNVSAGGSATISAGSDVAFDADGQVSGVDVDITAGDDITQADATVTSTRGYVDDEGDIHAAVDGTTVSLTAGGSIGKADASSSEYIGVKGSVTAKASGDVALAGAEGGDLDVKEIDAGHNASVYTAGTINPDGTIKAGSEVIVSANNFTGGIVPINTGSKLTVNNFRNSSYGNPLLALFKTDGGKKNPKVSNLPNKTIVFLDGRLAGGDLQTINKLGAMEAFPVQTPELKSEQGIFGNPVFLHDELGVANPLAVGAIDFLLLDIPRLTLSSDFPLEVEKQVAAAGLNPTTSYWFGQKSNEEEKKDAEGKSGDGKPSDAKGGGDAPTTENRTAMN